MSNQMKKSLLALAVLGAFAASAQAQSSVTIYGIVDAGATYQSKSGVNNNGLFAVESGLMSGSRLGFKGTEDLGGGLKANFVLESGFNTDTGAMSGQDFSGSSNLFRRTSTVGLSGGFGAINIGRQTDFAYSGTNGGTAMYSTAGYLGVFSSSNGTTQARLQGDRTNNSIRYDMPAVGGLTGGVMLGLGEQAGAGSAGQAYAAGLKYDNGPLSFGGSYYQSKEGATPADRNLYGATAAGQPVGTTGVKTFTLGASYVMGAGKLYGSWSRVKMATLATATGLTFNSGAGNSASNLAGTPASANDKLDIYEIGYNYDLTASLKLLTGFTHTRANFTTGDPKGKVNQLLIGTDYFLSKRTDFYAVATYMRSSDVANPLKLDITTANSSTNTTGGAYGLGVGIRHAF
jgi:predicted porin